MPRANATGTGPVLMSPGDAVGEQFGSVEPRGVGGRELATRTARPSEPPGLDTSRRGGPEPDDITLGASGREITEA